MSNLCICFDCCGHVSLGFTCGWQGAETAKKQHPTNENIFERIRLHGYIFLYIKADIYNIIKTKEQEIKNKYTVEKQKAEASAKQQSDATYTKSSIRNLKEAAAATAATAEIERQSRVAEPLRGGAHKTRRYKRYLHRSRKAIPRK